MTSREERDAAVAKRLIRQMAPQIQAVTEYMRQQHASLAATINEALAPQYQSMLKQVSDTVARIEFPALKIDYASLFPDFSAIGARTLEPAWQRIQLIEDGQREQFATVIAAARRALAAALPPNWVDADESLPKGLEAMLLDEGLPLAWVPPGPILAALFRASTAGERRRIIGRRWQTITSACVDELDKVADPSQRERVGFAREAAATLQGGNHRASQALSANLLDTILREQFDSSDRRKITNQKSRFNIENYPLHVAIVLGGIWGAHREFRPDNGDQIPRLFSCHGSVHGVSRRQYSRVNAVLALMHVVSLLRLIEHDLSD